MSDIVTQACVCFLPGSVPSLAAGLLFGGLAGLGAYQLSQDPRNVWVFLGMSASLSSQFILYPEDSTRGLVGCVRLLLPSPREVFKWGAGGSCWFLLIFYVHNMKRFSYLMNLDLPSEISTKLV